MPETWIYMSHPDVKGPPVYTTLESFLNLHENKGWEAVDAPKSVSESSVETFERVFGDVSKAEAAKGPKKKEAKPTSKSTS